MAVPFLLGSIGILFAMCAACFYRMGAADWTHEKKFLIDLLESLESENAKLREYVTKLEQANIVLDSNNTDLLNDMKDMQFFIAENAKLRELCEKLYGYYVSGTLTPCDFCDRYECEGTAPTTCKADEYEPDGIVTKEIERLMHELGMGVCEYD